VGQNLSDLKAFRLNPKPQSEEGVICQASQHRAKDENAKKEQHDLSPNLFEDLVSGFLLKTRTCANPLSCAGAHLTSPQSSVPISALV
jgi:hypothetical protein